MTAPVSCDRCGAYADADWCDVTSLGGPPEFMLGRCVCTTPGCVDEDGSPAVPPPDVPGRLTREDNRLLDGYRRTINEYGRAAHALAAGVEGW